MNSRSLSSNRGFTLLEVMVALAILAVSLVSILGINGGTVRSHSYAKRLTIATMLARSKMVDIETHFFHEGFTSRFDQTMQGDFSEEGWRDFKWKAEIVVPDLDAGMVTSLITQMGQEMLGGLEEEQREAERSGSTSGPRPDLRQAASGIEGMLQGQANQLVESLKSSLREVRLEVSWREGNREETLDLVTHILIPGGTGYSGGGNPPIPPGNNPPLPPNLPPNPPLPPQGGGR